MQCLYSIQNEKSSKSFIFWIQLIESIIEKHCSTRKSVISKSRLFNALCLTDRYFPSYIKEDKNHQQDKKNANKKLRIKDLDLNVKSVMGSV